MAEEQKLDATTYLANQEKEIIQDETKLEGLEADLSDFEAKIDEEFIKNYMQNISDEDREFIEIGDVDSDGDELEKKLSLILAARTTFVDEVIEKQRATVNEFKSALASKKTDYDRNKISAEFSKLHPELDMTDFGEFIVNDLTPNQNKLFVEEANGDGLAYFEKVLELYNKAKGITAKKEDGEQLPPDLDELGGASGGDESNPTNKKADEEYRRNALGIG